MWEVTPPSGWHYFEGETRIKADTHDNLVKSVTDYRSANHLPIGYPEKDVERFVCGRWPHICNLAAPPADEDEPKKIYGQVATRRISERIGSWAATRYARMSAVSLVTPEVAQSRANVCIGCPQNDKSWRQRTVEQCPPCASRLADIDTLLFKLRKGNEVQRSGQLGSCECAGHENATAVWLNEEFLKHSRHYQRPNICWMNQLSFNATSTASADKAANLAAKHAN